MSLTPNPHVFANSPLDRAGHLRGDPAYLAEKMDDASSLFVPLWRQMPLILPEVTPGEGKDVGWMPKAQVLPLAGNEPLIVFLGINKRGKALFAIDISSAPDPANQGPLKGMGEFEDLRGLGMAEALPAGDMAIMAQAKAMIHWHVSHMFCATCGNKSTLAEAGYKRECASCKTEHFPRTDPVVIMLATYEDNAFLGRQRGFPKGMFSALAGFMEPGESIEEAVARELDEEAKIATKSVRYHSTQPWPFPASLMIGCMAEAESMEFELDGIELSGGRWFTRTELAAAMAGEGDNFFVPPPFAIAHHLVKAFVEGW